jgi:hypothetical protein
VKEVVGKAKKSKFIEATQYTVDVVRHRKKEGGLGIVLYRAA